MTDKQLYSMAYSSIDIINHGLEIIFVLLISQQGMKLTTVGSFDIFELLRKLLVLKYIPLAMF